MGKLESRNNSIFKIIKIGIIFILIISILYFIYLKNITEKNNINYKKQLFVLNKKLEKIKDIEEDANLEIATLNNINNQIIEKKKNILTILKVWNKK